jgi:hypothetical protein
MKFLSLILLFATNVYAQETFEGKGRGLIYKGHQPRYGKTYSTFLNCENLPKEFDLRDLGIVPPVRDQGGCGSCWAFSKTASLESAHALMNGELLDLSEQELVSCDKQSWGCRGGFLSDFRYQIEFGQGLEKDFPYKGRDLSCKKIPAAAKGSGYFYAGKPDKTPTEKDVMCALYNSKTVPWTVVSAEGQWDVAPAGDDGVMQRCGSRDINHAVGLVGWKTIGGKVYFKVRNSWGNDWGSTAGRPGAEKGYTLAPHLCNLLNEEVAYIVTEKTCKPPQLENVASMVIEPNEDTPLSVREVEFDTKYAWYVGKTKVGTGPAIIINQDRPKTYRVVAKNSCGQSESMIQVEVQP